MASSTFIGHPFGAGWHVDRSRFDAMLASAAASAGARITTSTIARAFHRDGPDRRWTVTASGPAGAVEFRTTFLVDASGRSARLGRHLGRVRRRLDRLIGITRVAVAPGGAMVPSLVESHPRGWWYSSSLPDGRLVAILFTDSDIATADAWTDLLRASPHTGARASRCGPMAVPRSFPACSHTFDRSGGLTWLAVGDALVGRDPLSSSGIDFALATAERAARTLIELADGRRGAVDEFEADIESDFAAYLDQRRAYYALERRWEGMPFWLRRR